MVNKKKEGLSRLFEIAGQKKSLLLLAGLLSAGSAVCMLIPYWAIYRILYELLNHSRELSSIDETNMIRWGWIAFGGLIGGLLLLYASLMSSHVAAYRILYGLRVRLTEHIGRLPLGYLNGTSTGAIKKTMEQNVEKIENFIAHTIPDLVTGMFGSDRTKYILAIFQFHGKKGTGIYTHLLQRARADECFCRAICARNACGENLWTECPLIPSVQCRNRSLQDLCIESLRHLRIGYDIFYRTAQFDCHLHSPCRYFTNAK